MLVNQSRIENGLPLEQTQAIERVVRDIRSGKMWDASKNIEEFVSRYFDFMKSVDPQVKMLMKCVSSKYHAEKDTIEKMIDAALAIHESTDSISLND